MVRTTIASDPMQQQVKTEEPFICDPEFTVKFDYQNSSNRAVGGGGGAASLLISSKGGGGAEKNCH